MKGLKQFNTSKKGSKEGDREVGAYISQGNIFIYLFFYLFFYFYCFIYIYILCNHQTRTKTTLDRQKDMYVEMTRYC